MDASQLRLLDVADDADWPTVVASWRRIARTCHPDRSDDPLDHERYAQASAAYKRLREQHRQSIDDPIDPWEALDEFETLATGDDRPTVDDVLATGPPAPLPVPMPSLHEIPAAPISMASPAVPASPEGLTRRQAIGEWRRLADRLLQGRLPRP